MPFRFDDAAAYEHMMGRWSAGVAPPFLDWLALPAGLDWLDAGCGAGAFTQALLARQRPRSVVGVDPSPAQLDFARRRMRRDAVHFVVADAQSVPLPSASVDAATMALVLFFLPDPLRGVRELARVTRPGGTVAAYHWDMAGGGFPLQPIVDALRAEGLASHPPPSHWASSRDASAALWRDAGLADVQTCRIEVQRAFGHFDEFWSTARGSSRLRELLAALPDAQRRHVKQRVRQALGTPADGPLRLTATANAVKGRRH
ncbi:class I SAM-dependent methyltransferase [Ideonella sp.]|uniref:class I SAM-dependent methyltransferase n=1 Tax=Ideonella sp. TaxID=1929293 RepID=UPI0035B2D81B